MLYSVSINNLYFNTSTFTCILVIVQIYDFTGDQIDLSANPICSSA